MGSAVGSADLVCHLRRSACIDPYVTPCRRVQGGSDKDALMMQLMQQPSQAQEPTHDTTTGSGGGSNGTAADRKLAVYVGDSPSDFAPLLRADLGIVVGHNKLLRQVAKAHGVKLKPLTAG